VSAFRERPRLTVALCVALVVLVGIAMLAGGALAGGGDCASAGVAGMWHEHKGKA
jgi:hypothetical protein